MGNASSGKTTSISGASNLEEAAAFWDRNSLADHWSQTREAEFQIRAERRRRVTLAPEVYELLEAQARRQGVLPETLVNLWLSERLHQAS